MKLVTLPLPLLATFISTINAGTLRGAQEKVDVPDYMRTEAYKQQQKDAALKSRTGIEFTDHSDSAYAEAKVKDVKTEMAAFDFKSSPAYRKYKARSDEFRQETLANIGPYEQQHLKIESEIEEEIENAEKANEMDKVESLVNHYGESYNDVKIKEEAMKDHNSDLYINWKTSSVPKENEANDMDTDDPVIFPDANDMGTDDPVIFPVANDKEGVTDTDAVLDFSAKEEGIFPETEDMGTDDPVIFPDANDMGTDDPVIFPDANDMGTDDPVILPGDGDVTDTDAVLDFSAKEEGIFPETEDMVDDTPIILPGDGDATVTETVFDFNIKAEAKQDHDFSGYDSSAIGPDAMKDHNSEAYIQWKTSGMSYENNIESTLQDHGSSGFDATTIEPDAMKDHNSEAYIQWKTSGMQHESTIKNDEIDVEQSEEEILKLQKMFANIQTDLNELKEKYEDQELTELESDMDEFVEQHEDTLFGTTVESDMGGV